MTYNFAGFMFFLLQKEQKVKIQVKTPNFLWLTQKRKDLDKRRMIESEFSEKDININAFEWGYLFRKFID